jgi:hypothetical protein
MKNGCLMIWLCLQSKLLFTALNTAKRSALQVKLSWSPKVGRLNPAQVETFRISLMQALGDSARHEVLRFKMYLFLFAKRLEILTYLGEQVLVSSRGYDTDSGPDELTRLKRCCLSMESGKF